MEFLEHPLFVAIGNYITCILCLVLAILVFQANPRSKSCRLASLFNASVSFWALAYGTIFIVKDERHGIFVGQLISVGSIALSSFITHFVLVENKMERKRKKLIILNYFAAVLLCFLNFIPKIVIAGSPQKLNYATYVDAGPLYFLIPSYLFSNFFYSVYHIIRGIKKAKGYRKNQWILFLIALSVGYMTGTPGYLLVFDIPFPPFTTPFVAFYPLILSYAIMKHRFLNIQKLIKNSLIFTLLFLILLSFVAIVLFFLKQIINHWIGIPDGAAQAIAIAFAIAFYGPLKTMLSRLTHQVLYQHTLPPMAIFKRLTQDLFHVLQSDKLVQEATKRIAQILALERIGFYLRGNEPPYAFELVALQGHIRKKQILPASNLAQWFERTRQFVVSPFSEAESRMNHLSSPRKRGSMDPPVKPGDDIKTIKNDAAMEVSLLGGVAAFPVFLKNSLYGVLVVGNKKSDAPWLEEELGILASFMRHLALALGNAEYAHEIRRTRQEISLRERDSMAGAIIAGVDHEAKNPIHVISLNLGTLEARLNHPSAESQSKMEFEVLATKMMKRVIEDIKDVSSIIQHLSDLADKKPLTIRENVSPRQIAEKVLSYLQTEIHDNVIIRLEIIPELQFSCDPNALSEIFMNLIRNAIQAIAEKGEITIKAEKLENEIAIEIRDTGQGIPENLRERIFEPFFTTKRKEENANRAGTGMGLFIVKEYVKGMAGRITLESKSGKGTVFRLYFPVMDSMIERTAA